MNIRHFRIELFYFRINEGPFIHVDHRIRNHRYGREGGIDLRSSASAKKRITKVLEYKRTGRGLES
jgi:hypothetical protein